MDTLITPNSESFKGGRYTTNIVVHSTCINTMSKDIDPFVLVQDEKYRKEIQTLIQMIKRDIGEMLALRYETLLSSSEQAEIL